MWCPTGPGAWSLLGCVEGDPGLGHSGTAKGTGPHQGGCGELRHEGKVLGADGASALTCLQEGSREPEDAVLSNLT